MTGAGPADREVWERLAGDYARQERWEHRALEAAVRLAASGTGDVVVDLATGTGAIPRALARRRARPAVVVGVDRSPAMLGQVGPLPPGWSTLVADVRDVPLGRDAFDVVTCTYLLQLLAPAEQRDVLAEARRLLRPRPGSRLVVVTPWYDAGRPGARVLGAAAAIGARRFPARLGGLRPLDPTAVLAQAGFRVTHRVQLPRGGYPSLVVRAELSAASVGPARSAGRP